MLEPEDTSPPGLTFEVLLESALRYLQSYETTEAHLASVLERKIYKKIQGGDQRLEDYSALVLAVVQSCVDRGFVDDRRHVELFINSGFAEKMSQRKIEMKLRQKGLNPSEYEDLLDRGSDEEFNAAIAFARKKGLVRFETIPK